MRGTGQRKRGAKGRRCKRSPRSAALAVPARRRRAGRAARSPSTPSSSAPTRAASRSRRYGEPYEDRGDTLQIETAAGPDGVTGRMSVSAVTPGHQPKLDRVRADEPDRQARGALADGGPLQRRRARASFGRISMRAASRP